ncbi:MAG TPA: Ppx/GppA phosphatase family protein [Acidobacteriota bacterium]|jgi:exopolyphosphatase/guanosine-5'-triphosphate,3'-diphosphate pyrophosphatase
MMFQVGKLKARSPKRAAIIDLGSNTARVILINFRPAYTYHLEDEIREVVRLREAMTRNGLAQDAMARGLSTLRLFKQYCDAMAADIIIPTTTSAVREAANGRKFVRRVRKETGLKLQVLSGEREAYYGTLGVLNCTPLQDGVVVDIGGGSVQVSQVNSRRFERGEALTLGALALTERFVRSDPPKRREIREIKREIERQIGSLRWLSHLSGPLVGLGGTIRNLARIEASRQAFPLNRINGFVLTRSSVKKTTGLLEEFPVRERKEIPGLSKDRADIILAGALVVESVMESLDVKELTVSQYGLREGLFFEHFWKRLRYPVASDPGEFSVLNMARFYDYQERHAHHVGRLALRLFDQMAPLHAYGDWERRLLHTAALLHDIGTVISYNDHHKHSQMLIAGNGIPGYSPRETALIALLARYHRDGNPSLGDYRSLLPSEDELRVARLAALLRLSECLERGKNSRVRDVVVKWNEGQLVLTLVAETTPVVEIWDAERLAVDLMEKTYKRSIVFKTRIGT